jgi:hypothetical protein
VSNIITAWSFSRLATYRKCPRQFKYQFIDKLPQPPAPAMERGSKIDDGVRAYVEGKAKKLPVVDGTNYGKLVKVYADMRKAKTMCQLELAVDASWKPVSWFDRSTWLRAKLDHELWLPKEKLAKVDDTKSGKMWPDHTEQLEIYAIVEWAHRPLAEAVECRMLYVDQGIAGPVSLFTDRPVTEKRLRKKWAAEAKPVLADRKFKAKPGDACKWCPYSGRKGGPCDKG